MLRYEGTIWRPPSEAKSLILQATIGCSHNACTFCISYRDRKFRVRGAKGIAADLAGLPSLLKEGVQRVFLADGDALAMSTPEMLDVLGVLRRELPRLQRVGVYAYTKNLREKSVEDLKQMRDAGLGIVYLGIETGDEELWRWVRKGVTVSETIAACRKIREAGIPLSLTVILGLGGLENSERHAVATAQALNEIDPEYVGALTLMIPRGTPLYSLVKNGEFEPMKPFDILRELRTMVTHLSLTNCVFRTNHASNYLPLRGTLSRDKQKILDVIDRVIESHDEGALRPSYLRGL
ncbi:MAG: radical SAM protein [Candidatus Thorarchaeota archaeon]